MVSPFLSIRLALAACLDSRLLADFLEINRSKRRLDFRTCPSKVEGGSFLVPAAEIPRVPTRLGV